MSIWYEARVCTTAPKDGCRGDTEVCGHRHQTPTAAGACLRRMVPRLEVDDRTRGLIVLVVVDQSLSGREILPTGISSTGSRRRAG
jgi:hypothetical protein